jgi:hypothetical protein
MRTTLLLIVLSTVGQGAKLSLPPSATVQAQAGDTVGWGYLLTDNRGYSVPTFSEFTPDSAFGLYFDFVSLPQNFVVVTPVAAGGEFYNQTNETGAGEFFTDPTTPDGTVIHGTITLHYDLYSNNPDVNPDSFVSGDNTVSANVAITVTGLQETPEPVTFGLMGVALGLLASRRLAHRRRR